MTKSVAQRKRPLTLFQARDHLRRADLAYNGVMDRYLRCIRDSEPPRVVDALKLDLDKASVRLYYWREHVRLILMREER